MNTVVINCAISPIAPMLVNINMRLHGKAAQRGSNDSIMPAAKNLAVLSRRSRGRKVRKRITRKTAAHRVTVFRVAGYMKRYEDDGSRVNWPVKKNAVNVGIRLMKFRGSFSGSTYMPIFSQP